MIVRLEIFLNILKSIGLDLNTNNHNYNLSIVNENDNVAFNTLYFYKEVFTMYTKLKISKDNFENVDNIENLILSKEHLYKICLLSKWYPKSFLQIEVNYDIINISIAENENNSETIQYSIMTEAKTDNLVEEPLLLKNTCTINTDNLKKGIELCLYNGQCIEFVLEKHCIIIRNELMDTQVKVPCEILKKAYIEKFKISYENITLILQKLAFVKSKDCLLYVEKGLPFVIENNGFCSGSSLRIYSEYF